MQGFNINLEQETLDNSNFRKVLFTGEHSQLVVMSIAPKDDIGMEVHANIDQFIRVEAGVGKAIIDADEFDLEDGSAVIVPAGADHNVINTSETEALKLYTVYSPAEHAPGTVHETKEDALADSHHH